jgi:hypothetical protein
MAASDTRFESRRDCRARMARPVEELGDGGFEKRVGNQESRSAEIELTTLLDSMFAECFSHGVRRRICLGNGRDGDVKSVRGYEATRLWGTMGKQLP